MFYNIVLIWMFLVSVALAYAVFHIMRRKPTTGALGMIGVKGKIGGKRNEFWQVSVRGEIWQAESRGSVKIGDHVIVDAVNGLVLVVKKLHSS